MADADVIKRTLAPQELLDNGVIWAINRVLFHPRGYALGINTEDATFELWGNGDEPWEFRSVDEDAKMKAFNALLESVTAHE